MDVISEGLIKFKNSMCQQLTRATQKDDSAASLMEKLPVRSLTQFHNKTRFVSQPHAIGPGK